MILDPIERQAVFRRNLEKLGVRYLQCLRTAFGAAPFRAITVFGMSRLVGNQLHRATKKAIRLSLSACAVPFGPRSEDYQRCKDALSSSRPVPDVVGQIMAPGGIEPKWFVDLMLWEEDYWQQAAYLASTEGPEVAGTVFALQDRTLLHALEYADIESIKRLAGTLTACHLRRSTAYHYLAVCIALDEGESERMTIAGLVDCTSVHT